MIRQAAAIFADRSPIPPPPARVPGRAGRSGPVARGQGQGCDAVRPQLWPGPVAEPQMKAASVGRGRSWLWPPLRQLACSWP